MTKRRRVLYGLFFFLGIIALVAAMYNSEKNGPAYAVKPAVEKAIADWLVAGDTTTKKALAEIGGTEWDWVCICGSYTDGRDMARRNFMHDPVDISKFAIADEIFLDAEYGLAFISVQKKLLVTTRVPYAVVFNPKNKAFHRRACLRAKAFYLSKTRQGKLDMVSVTDIP